MWVRVNRDKALSEFLSECAADMGPDDLVSDETRRAIEDR